MQTIERIGELLAQLQSPDFFAREEAVKELGTFRQDEAVAGLVLAIEDTDLGIRELAADLLTKIKGMTAAQLLCRFLAHPDIGTRNLASEILVRFGGEAVLPLIAELENEDHDVRKFSVDILGLIGDSRATESLCQRLWDENTNVVCSAAEALGEIGSPAAVPHLLAAYEKIEDVRLQSVEALGKIGDAAALTKLHKWLSNDDPVIQYSIIDAIGNIGRQESLTHLAPILDSPDATIAEAAMSAVVTISCKTGGSLDFDLPLDRFADYLFDGIKRGNKEITDFTLSRLTNWYGTRVVRNLLDSLDYIEEQKMGRVVEAICDIGPRVVPALIEKLHSSSKETKLRLLGILKRLNLQDISPDLVRIADDTEPEVRQQVAYLLGATYDNTYLAPLKRLALDPNGHVRAAAFSALGWLCSEGDVDFLFAGLEDKYPDVREAAVGALIIVGGPRVVAKFTADLYHTEVDRQRLAVTALGWIGESDVIEPLLRAVNHPDAGVRKSAIGALARIGDVFNVDPIVIALNDENSGVRKAAISALVALEQDRALHHVRFLLEDPDVWVRYHAIDAVAGLGAASSVDLLLPYLNDEQDIIKIAASKALARLGAAQAMPALQNLRNERNKDVVEAADMAVATLKGKGLE